jgi:hypothetical protein
MYDQSVADLELIGRHVYRHRRSLQFPTIAPAMAHLPLFQLVGI